MNYTLTSKIQPEKVWFKVSDWVLLYKIFLGKLFRINTIFNRNHLHFLWP